MSACRSTIRRSRAFSSAIAACEASELAASRSSVSKAWPTIVSVPKVGPAGGEPELDSLALSVRLAGLDDGAVARKQAGALRARHLDRGFDDDPQLLIDVVRRRERLAEARDRVSEPAALGLELCEPLLELIRHLVERGPEHRELVAAANGDALGEPPSSDPMRRLGETP